MSLIMHRPAAKPPQANDEARWNALCAREASADGGFIYGVQTTGVYCRPSCPSRRPRRENVSFFDDAVAAAAAGYRACKRCRPDQPTADTQVAAMLARICRHIEQAETPPDLDTLASMAGLSRFHFHRLFKAHVGVTPRAYASAARRARVHDALGDEGSVTEAIYRAGFNSHGRFYATSNASLGMTPSAYRARGVGTRIRFALGECSLGSILVAATARGLCMIALGDDPEALLREFETRFSEADLIGGDGDFERTVAQVITLIEQPAQGHELPLDLKGTAFQERVWEALTRIPPGRTVSYSEIAEAIGQPQAARAVARACAANELAVAIPCHRVVRRDGALSGYRWGVERKRVLLAREHGA